MLTRRDCLALAGFGPAIKPGFAAAGATFPTVIASRVERVFRTPGPQPNALQAVKEGLWILDQRQNRVALVRYSGSIIREFDTKTESGSGITFDGQALWIGSTYNRLIVRVDAHNGRTLRELACPGAGVVKWGPRAAHPQATGSHGLEWRSGELWAAVPPAATIFVLNPEDGSVRRSFPAPGVRPHGIGWDPDGSLWCAESIYRSFFKMDPRIGRILRQVMLPPTAPEVDGLVQVPHGMTVWNREFWFSVAETGEVYRLPLA